jgi:peptide/nickel transport system ATP-binding protein
MNAGDFLLDVRDLTLRVGRTGPVVVNHVDFTVARGEIVGIVGESGSGKTLAARAVMDLVPPVIEKVAGSVRFEGEDIATMSSRRLRALRGARVGMVFQEPMTSLNPSMRIGDQLGEGLALHRQLDKAERRALILDMLHRVGIRDPEDALIAFPHQFSGGMRQRIMFASVMLLKPALLIADEPTTALDAVVQRDVLELMVGLTRENGTAVLMISHDLGMIARYSDRVIVMSQGEVVEHGRTRDLLASPQHPYTRKLLGAMPHRGPVRHFPAGGAPIISVRDLAVVYGGGQGLFRKGPVKQALAGVSLDIAPGQIVAVVGGSG